MRIRISLSGRNYHAAAALPETLELPDRATLADALSSLNEALPEGASLSPNSLLALSGEHVGTVANHADRKLSEGDELVVIAPVAGG